MRIPSRSAFLGAAALAMVLLWNPLGAQGVTAPTLIAEAEAADLPAEAVVRVFEGILTPNDPPMTHRHPPGWVYAAEGAHLLTLGGRTVLISPGRAVWIPSGVIHTHNGERSRTHRFLSIEMGTNETPSIPPGFRLLRGTYDQVLSDPLRLESGTYLVRLSHLTLQPGERGAPTSILQPEVMIGLSGETSILTYQNRTSGCAYVKVGQVHVMHAPSAYLMRNEFPTPSLLLVQSLIPKE